MQELQQALCPTLAGSRWGSAEGRNNLRPPRTGASSDRRALSKRRKSSRPEEIFGSDDQLPASTTRRSAKWQKSCLKGTKKLHPVSTLHRSRSRFRHLWVIDSRTPPVSLSELKRQRKDYQHVEKWSAYNRTFWNRLEGREGRQGAERKGGRKSQSIPIPLHQK